MTNYSTFIKLMCENILRAVNSILSQFENADGTPLSISFTYTISDNVKRK